MAGLSLMSSTPQAPLPASDPEPRRAPGRRPSPTALHPAEQGLPRLLFDAVLRSYAQVLFSRSRLVGGVLLAATFLSPRVGLCGLLAAALAAGLGLALRLPRTDLREGLYGYNAMLVGLGVGALFEPGAGSLAVLVLGVGAALLGTAAARSLLTGVLALPV
ncbi:MAG: urea transporter, partial [Alphaproteobacteria bacterium]|nr:urea transporter [Alphaproteobacteria bacterium]